jgi:outer membrane protein TolC
MVASRSMVAMLVGALGIACAGSGMSASHAMAHPRLERAEGPPAESAPRASARPWWLAFESETLNTLIAEAGRNAASAASANSAERLDAPAVEIGVSASYVALLAHTLGLTYIDSARAFLAARSSLPEEKLQKAIDDEVAARKQPRFALPLPEALPAVLLANRDDIQLAAALYGIDPQTRLDGTIDAAEEDPDEGDRVAGADLSGYPLFSDALAQGRAEVSGALRKLQAASAAAADANRRVREAKGLFEESKTRMSRGEMSEIQVLEDYQGLMLDLQRLTVSNGNLAIAWITLMASLGSRTPLVLHAPHAPAAAGLGGRSRLVGAFAF